MNTLLLDMCVFKSKSVCVGSSTNIKINLLSVSHRAVRKGQFVCFLCVCTMGIHTIILMYVSIYVRAVCGGESGVMIANIMTLENPVVFFL